MKLSLACSIFTFLIITFSSSVSGSGGESKITLLLNNSNNTACIAEKLRATDKYICDHEGNVICMSGWDHPHKLCETPVCNINGKSCVNGKCIGPNLCACEVGWDGPTCSECIPLGGCSKNGFCENPMECQCKQGWTGSKCDKPECNDCKNGCCHEPNVCVCDNGWKGPKCDQCETLSNCKFGKCVSHPFECQCFDGWKGNGCSKPTCREGCHPQNGSCKKPGECVCKRGWKGRDCDECMPYPGCKGTCINNIPWTCSNFGHDHVSFADQWSNWGEWSECSASCGEGKQRRERACPGKHHGASGSCVGGSSETRTCLTNFCAINGSWGRWGRWSSCSSSCGSGLRSRTRICNHPAPKYGGHPCKGSDKEESTCFTRSCPVDGKWSSWQAWEKCSVSCGDGNKKRSRNCDSPAATHGGRTCFGITTENTKCTQESCPIDATWQAWSQWTTCSKTCGDGIKTRDRKCGAPLFGGRPCPGGVTDENQVEKCFTKKDCDVDGSWSLWQAWSECSVTCGSGHKIKDRLCNNPAPKFGGKVCSGQAWAQEVCQSVPCAVDGKWAQWNQWGSCSASCGNGNQRRNRICDGPFNGGQPCTGTAVDQRPCLQITPCPVDGIWTEWSEWRDCSKTCGGGFKNRDRSCNGALFGGKNCVGVAWDQEPCGHESCPIDGKWSQWNQWSSCSKTCNGGVKSRDRQCVGAQFGGKKCEGNVWDQVDCNANVPCVTEGKWIQWAQWSTCSKTCGSGTQSRQRKCNKSFGGQPCQGSGFDQRSCNQHECPKKPQWSQWTQWGTCSATCGGGNRNRERSCQSPHGFSSSGCDGTSWESGACNEHACPVDGKWAQWAQWSSCSATCGGGSKNRHRICHNSFGGRPCQGSDFEQTSCGQQSCSTNGNWGQWSQWSTCSTSCGTGIKRRGRACDSPSPIGRGLPCEGHGNDEQTCSSNGGYCPIDGGLTEWSQWSECTVKCKGDRGDQVRRKFCTNPRPQYGGRDCSGQRKDKRFCTGTIAKQSHDPSTVCFHIKE